MMPWHGSGEGTSAYRHNEAAQQARYASNGSVKRQCMIGKATKIW